MRLTSATWTAIAHTGVALGVAALAWTSLPPGAGVATNYLGFDGVRHAGVSREILWLLPFVSAIVTLAMMAVRQRLREETAALPLEVTMVAVTGVLLVTEAALVGRAFDPAFNVLRPVAGAVGVLLIAVGNYLGKARRNAIFGVRTPWTLADATVWDRTHRFTGAGMVGGGVVLLVLAILLRDTTALGAAMAVCAAVPPLAGAARSRSLHRDLQRG